MSGGSFPRGSWAPGPPAPPGRVRWGIGDVVLAWVVGLVVAILVIPVSPDPEQEAVGLFILLLAQDVPIVAYLWWVSRRKGLGSLRADFGLTVRRADVRWFFAGVGLQIAAIVVLAPLALLYGKDESQDVVELARRATGYEIPLVVLAVALIAPVVEELLFRGVLLRALLRKTTPAWSIVGSGVVFGLVHLADPSLGSVMALPAIVALGVISAHQARSTGDLSRSILLHMGFNALSAVLLFL